MRGLQVLAALAGLVTVLGGIGGLSWWSSRDAAADSPDDWHPKCTARLGWDAVDVEVTAAEQVQQYTLFGVDFSPSNEELANTQLDAVVALAGDLPADHGTGILLVSDRSDRSSTPDLPLAGPLAARQIQVTGLPCWPDCEVDSLFAQRCQAQLQTAIDTRMEGLTDQLEGRGAQHVQARVQKLEGWRVEVSDWKPRPGTSILKFWRKVADLPQLRRSPASTRVVLLSDLEEARTHDRKIIDRVHRAFERDGSCMDEPGLPNLEGVQIVLLQTVTDRIPAEKWGRKWETTLRCAGADVVRHRYSPAIPLREYLPKA
jgi:hypothetical protein